MRIKKLLLYVIITVLFFTSFYVVNLRFDKFYRVNGINNDNRVVLESYLSDDEQEYLIENQISLDLFYDYIKIDSFSLYNYKYYNLLKENTSMSKKNIVETGNKLVDQLSITYPSKTFEHAQKIVTNDLQDAYFNNVNFKYDYIDYYTLLKPLYKSNDYSFIEDTNIYIAKFDSDNINEKKYKDYFTYITEDYKTYENINSFMNATLIDSKYRVYHPSDITVVLDENSYIGNYSPSNIVLVNNLRRVKYATYLNNDALTALEAMNKALKKDISQEMIIYKAYDTSSYNKEFQLGNTIDVSEIGLNYNKFEEGAVFSWLNEHCHEYGYILRYPKNKASINNTPFNSHIFRYVGTEISEQIHENDWCLEEYNVESDR